MRIVTDKKMEAFFQRCRRNLNDSSINSFLDRQVSPKEEPVLIHALQKAGAAEFSKKPYPSLFLSADEWENSPYHRTIRLERIADDHFSYEKLPVYGCRLFNADAIQKDPDRELRDWMKLRAMDRDFEAVYLYQDDRDWMMDAPSEAVTNDPAAAKAHGSVLTFGLGIGYFLFMASRNPKVRKITCVEYSPAVIRMFQKYILPQFPQGPEIEIIQGDAFRLWSRDFLSRFDYVYTDIWQSSEDGLAAMSRLLEIYMPPLEKADFWIENSCLEVMWTLSFLYFDALAHKRKVQAAPHVLSYLRKIRRYYEKSTETVDSTERLKFLMYDTETIRQILHTKA